MKQRSAAYPSYTLEDSLEFSEKIYKNYGSSYRAKREEIAGALGYSVGSLTQKISSASQYGLLDMISKEGYQVTDLFVKYFRPISEKAKKEAIVQAFKSPPLYENLLAVFDNNILPPVAPLANILLQKHSISEKACDKAAEIFEQNIIFVGGLNQDRRISFNIEEIEVFEDQEEIIEDTTPDVLDSKYSHSQESNTPNLYKDPVDFKNTSQNSNNQNFSKNNSNNNNAIPHNIPLKNKLPAQLLLPSDVTAADFDFIISYIGLIRNQY